MQIHVFKLCTECCGTIWMRPFDPEALIETCLKQGFFCANNIKFKLILEFQQKIIDFDGKTTGQYQNKTI